MAKRYTLEAEQPQEPNENPRQRVYNPRNKIRNAIIKLSVIGVGLLAAYSAFFTVDQSEQAVVRRFGNPKTVILNPLERKDQEQRTKELKESYTREGIASEEGAGLKFKLPFIESVAKSDRRITKWNGYEENITTKDKRNIVVDPTARAFIEDPLQHLRRNGGTEASFHARLDDKVDSQVRNSISSRSLIEIVRTDPSKKLISTEAELADTMNVGIAEEGRVKVIGEIVSKSNEALREYGISVYDEGFLLKGVSYVPEVKTNVEDRMISERLRVAEKYLSEGKGESDNIKGKKEREVARIMSEAYKRAEEIRGKADGDATKIYAQGFEQEVKDPQGNILRTEKIVGFNTDPGFYQFVRTLELYEKSLPTGGKTRLVIGTDNPLLKNFKGESYSPSIGK